MTRSKRDRIVLEHLPLVKAIAIRVHENLPVHVDLDDIIHAGVLGLFEAAVKFDPKKQVAFSSYAKHRIRGAILDSLRELDWASRDMRRRQKQIEAVASELAATLGRTATDAEVAIKLGVTVERYRRMLVDLRSVDLISASSRTSKDDDLPAPDFPCPLALHPDQQCLNNELSTALKGALDILPPRCRQVMELYYRQDLTMKEIGEVIGVNESRVSQIHASAVKKLRAHLESNGISGVKAFAAAA